MFLSKYKGFKILFIYFTVSFLGILIELAGYFISAPFDFSMLVSIFGRIAAIPPLLFVMLKVFRPLYMQMLRRLNKGWSFFCLIPLLSFILLYLLGRYPISIFDHPENIFPMLLVVAITFLVYGVILIFFRQMQRQFDMQSEQQLLKLQVVALQNQSKAIWESEEKTRILRHDMRHYVQNISTLLQAGDIQHAIEFTSKTGNILEEAKITKYCENPSVNAILAYHLEAAKKEGISVKTRLDMGETPVDAMELSTVIANAIENARNACRMMPEGSAKSIELVCVSKPHFVFECSNTYSGDVLFDKNGMPSSNVEGHGIGTRSITAFAKKYNALIDYQAGSGIFKLRILLS
jgi:Signal transduction histidine kinase regulating citrate/malate metabolism